MTLKEKIESILFDARQDDKDKEKYIWVKYYGNKSVAEAILEVIKESVPDIPGNLAYQFLKGCEYYRAEMLKMLGE